MKIERREADSGDRQEGPSPPEKFEPEKKDLNREYQDGGVRDKQAESAAPVSPQCSANTPE